MVDFLVRKFRRKFNLDKERALLGDASGVIYEPNRKGYVRVRKQAANGLFTAPAVVRLGRAQVNMTPNKAIWLGYDEDDEVTVIGPDFSGQLAQGDNPYSNNMGDRNLYAYTNQDSIVTLLSHARQPASMTVAVRGFYSISETAVTEFPGGTITLQAPTYGTQHRLAAIFLKSDMTLEATYGTVQSIVEPLDTSDMTECVLNKTAYAIPIAFWRVYGSQTVVIDTDKWADGRQFINIPAP